MTRTLRLQVTDDPDARAVAALVVETAARIAPDVDVRAATVADEAPSVRLAGVERPVDAVVTLCAEEVCPVWLEPAWRVHWGLPDPAGAGANAEEEPQAFRDVRDELTSRFEVLFGAGPV